jgi:alkylhydroperoxidase family enzyme
MTQRIRGVTDEEAEKIGPVKDLFAASNQMLGRIANLQRILAHSPHVAKWFLPLIAAVRQPRAGAVSDVRLRNLAVLKTSTINGCRY